MKRNDRDVGVSEGDEVRKKLEPLTVTVDESTSPVFDFLVGIEERKKV